MNIIVKSITVEEGENNSNFISLINEYAEESTIKGLPHNRLKIETYKQLATSKFLHCIGAFVDDILIGFSVVLTPVLPHHDVQMAISDALFVAKAYRDTGAGLKLIKASEEYAKNIGLAGILISAPLGGVLAEVLAHKKEYIECTRVFYRKFNNE